MWPMINQPFAVVPALRALMCKWRMTLRASKQLKEFQLDDEVETKQLERS